MPTKIQIYNWIHCVIAVVLLTAAIFRALRIVKLNIIQFIITIIDAFHYVIILSRQACSLITSVIKKCNF